MTYIPTYCIQYYATQNKIHILDAYKQLYDNTIINIDLTNDGNAFVCNKQ